MLVYQSVRALCVTGQPQGPLCIFGILKLRYTLGYISQGHTGEHAGIVLVLLALLQLVRQLDHRFLLGRIHTRLEPGKSLGLCFEAPLGQLGVGCHHERDAVRVVEQESLRQLTDIAGIADLAAQRIQNRVQIQHGDRIGIVCSGAERLQNKLQAIGVAAPGDFTLVQFQLV